jgi:hypothetical protein
MSARPRVVAACAAASRSRSASAAAWWSSQRSPSSATARASLFASIGSRDRRRATARLTASGPISRTVAAWPALGEMASEASVCISARTSSGLPPVASWQAAVKSSSGSAPRRSRASEATAPALSGPGRSITAPGSEKISISMFDSRLCSGGREATSRRSGSSSTRRSR